MLKNNRYNIALSLPDNIKSVLYDLSKKLNGYQDLVHILDDSYCIHMTLYVTEFSEGTLEEITKHLVEIMKNFKSLELSSSNFNVRHGYLSLEFELTEDIKKLHEEVVLSLENLRLKDDEVLKAKKLNFSEEDYKLFAEHGSRNVLEKFQPHISLAKFVNNKAAENALERVKKEINLDSNISGVADGLKILDSHSGCCKKIAYLEFDKK